MRQQVPIIIAVLALGAALGAGHARAGDALKIDKRTLKAANADYAIDAEYPQVGIASIDDDIKDWVEAEAADFRKSAAPDPQSATGAWTLDIGYSIERNDAKALAVLFTESTYTGGAHPNHGFRTFNYLLPDGARVDLAQVVDGRKGLARLSEIVGADLVKRIGGADGVSDAESIRSGTTPEWANFENFLLLPDALEFHFPPYQVAAYFAGPQEARVALAALRGVLRTDWRAPVASFDCAKAATPVEHAVCADATLARLDREVAQAYATRQHNVSGDAATAQALRTAQRTWLGHRDAACKDRTGATLAACLVGVYRTRLAELSQTP